MKCASKRDGMREDRYRKTVDNSGDEENSELESLE